MCDYAVMELRYSTDTPDINGEVSGLTEQTSVFSVSFDLLTVDC